MSSRPLYSTDLNPIDHLWDVVEDLLAAHKSAAEECFHNTVELMP